MRRFRVSLASLSLSSWLVSFDDLQFQQPKLLGLVFELSDDMTQPADALYVACVEVIGGVVNHENRSLQAVGGFDVVRHDSASQNDSRTAGGYLPDNESDVRRPFTAISRQIAHASVSRIFENACICWGWCGAARED